uniref:Uncharacterized protein n=1 Tax=Heterosigma akashiwo TaxID=2829 RepID=A0A1D8GXK7_HETAK|nr:hypothetical protein [Heterosigma akashiwo]AOT84816.1 hypothetical protein [Heterosigma akashiwo]AOT84858.1 hypothetical protein [Heterosigma akashiwo]
MLPQTRVRPSNECYHSVFSLFKVRSLSFGSFKKDWLFFKIRIFFASLKACLF